MEIFKHTNGKYSGTEYSILVDMFPKPVEIWMEEHSNLDFANECALILKNLSVPVKRHLCRACELYCNDFLDSVGEPLLQFSDEFSVLDNIDPSTLIIPVSDRSHKPVVHMELNCKWEPEHGMEWIVRNNAVLYVGPFNGEDPYGDFSEQHPWNYAWQTVQSS